MPWPCVFAGWDCDTQGALKANAAAAGGRMPDMDAFWADWGRGMFGSDAQVSEFFAPLRELEALRPSIKGAGNLERFDYWRNLVRASHPRVRTWLLADHLAAKMKQVNAAPDADRKSSLVRDEGLPLRLDLARSYEDLIVAFVACARSPGEIGTISSIESGSRGRIVSAHDAAIAQILGAPLPTEAAVSTAYQGTPRIFVSARRTQMNAGESQEIRAFVVSGPKCTGVNLYWRPLGQGRFKQLAAAHRARQAYRATLPASSRGTLECYLEASLEDGQRTRWPATAPSINQTVTVW